MKGEAGGIVLTADAEAKSRLEIPPTGQASVVWTSDNTKGARAQVLSVYSDLHQKRGKKRDRAQKLSVVQHQKWTQTFFYHLLT